MYDLEKAAPWGWEYVESFPTVEAATREAELQRYVYWRVIKIHAGN